MALRGGATRINSWPMPKVLVIPSVARDPIEHAVCLPGSAYQ